MTSPFRPATPPGQVQTHPTVPFGLPNAPPTVIVPPNGQMPSWDQQAQQNNQQQQQQNPQGQPLVAPAGNPAPQYFDQNGQRIDQYGRPLAPTAPPAPSTFPPGTQPFFQAPTQQQQQQPARQNIPDDFVFDGENVPQELRGRTWRQVRGVYGALAQEFIARPGSTPAPAPNMPAGVPAPQQNQQAPVEEDPATSFWKNPLAAIERVVDSRLAPINQRNSVVAAEEARSLAASQIPDFASLEAEIVTIAQAMPREQAAAALTNPAWWANAADLARGRLFSRGQYQAPQQQQQNQQSQQSQQQQRQVPQQFQRSVPATHEFFTEAPTAPQGNTFVGGNQFNGQELTPEQKMYASKMNMTEQEYRDWSGGVQRPGNARRW